MNNVPLYLKKDQERRLRAGHCWIYSNEIDSDRTPLREFSAGQPVEILNHRGKWLGSGYINPHSLICARLVSRDRDHPLNVSLMVHRLKIALALRERLYPGPYYRLVFGEGDGLPGLVVDRYDDTLVIQINTAGMEWIREEIVAAVSKVVKPGCVILRNDATARESEGLSRYTEVVQGTPPEYLEVKEHGFRFQVDATQGQKTGWFYDQSFNRRRMLGYVAGLRVLDVCSYVGAWGVQAAAAGATEVFCIDSSSSALDAAQRNAALNGVSEQMAVVEGDAFQALRDLRAGGEKFDVVVVDPPAFIKRRKDIREGELAYRRLNESAMQLLSRDGILISSSCSHHMARGRLLQTLQQAGRHLDRSLQLLEQGSQSPDHPIHPAMPETAYLKTFYMRVLPSF